MVTIDKFSRTPVYEQIADGFCREVLCGLMPEGAQMPSVRELSVLLATNPNTVQKAYLELDRRGVISSAPGVGSFIRPGAADAIREGMKSRMSEITAIARELALAGIPEEEVLDCIRSAYRDPDQPKTEKE
ncbi:MAG: GntR family transcriptional regulator [Clostridia bacterium]|nr:GntR family transcriptional regulator [Clostridia bacterium]